MLQTSLFGVEKQSVEETRVIGDPDGLRDYQRERVDETLSLIKDNRSCTMTLHPGAGKTVIGSVMAKHWPGRVLWLAHRGFLCTQARVTLSRVCKQYVDLEKAGWRSGDSRVVVASVQTLRGQRLRNFRPDSFSLIICDEFHHGAAPGYREIFDWFADAKLIGLTATPKRADKLGLWNVSETHCKPFGVEHGVEWGSFVPVISVAECLDEIQLSKIKTVAGDFALNELEEQIAAACAPIAQLAVKHMKDRQTIIYTPGVASAHAVAATLRKMGKTSAAVDAKTDEITRSRIQKDFENEEIQYIVNCGIYTEGYDAPNCRGIVMARPTKSESLYCQAAMRGGRPLSHVGYLATPEARRAAIAASAKPNFLLLDITGQPGKHSLATAIDILGGDAIDEKVKSKVSELDSLDGEDLTSKIARAKKEVEDEEVAAQQAEMANQARIAEAAAKAEVKSRSHSFDAFKKLGFDDRQHGTEIDNPKQPASVADVEWLKKNKLPFRNATREYVDKLKNQARQWAKDGMATWAMRKMLSGYGLPVDMKFVDAGPIIGYIKRMQFRPDKRVLDEMVSKTKGNKDVSSTSDSDYGTIPF